MKIVVVTSIVNIIILILSIVFADKSIKYAKESSDWIRFAKQNITIDYFNHYYYPYTFIFTYFWLHFK